MNSVKRVLIIRGSAIGDVLHATPLSAALKEAFPHLEITWIVEEICGDVVLGNPYLHEVIVTPRSRWKQGRLTSPRIWREYLAFLRSLRARRFDVTLDLQGYAKSAILVVGAGAPYRLGWWRLKDGANLASTAIPRRAESVHRVDWFLDVARALGAPPCVVRFPLQIPDEARLHVETLLRTGGIDVSRPYAVLNQAAGDQTRRWSEVGYAQVAWELAQNYRMPSVLVGVDKDAGPNAAIIQQYHALAAKSPAASGPRIPEPLDVAGKTDMKQLFALIDRCAIQISGDTGSLHIADALNRPLIGLYGSSDPAHAGPWHQRANVLSRRDLCRPECTLRHCVHPEDGKTEDGRRKSGRADEERKAQEVDPRLSTCLMAITPDDVMRKVAELLNGAKGMGEVAPTSEAKPETRVE